ncbi:protein serine/threonine phosphatase 2C [Saitoella complicata NRRL Y-17804]|uniref:PPM-type phosphatase domain-containing protein n=1 Tax=Saitoella complicata (strain BCRC 22490 / CBS 7301 / JCM 7358 / NBRC 10748 / NRRL Y-17804) TaxID=698492 RepID=A0A0E9NST9_SAICN|nr:protein serine/threonine phosphatase 2C [Saitoella complicata NRRL Y-17804]ODQ51286.1 protein serine/threonine phosphatase 2C [Saitoella complicata NRRL Y-17804]GAO52736.1 hypothetical protein G7K_6806-t1 [Saitoella complicata NRRL Y-17804]
MSSPTAASSFGVTTESTTITDLGVFRAQGSRNHQEDRYTVLSPSSDPAGDIPPNYAFYAIYDGHGSAAVSSHARANLHKYLFGSKAFREGDLEGAMREAFKKEDEALFEMLLEVNDEEWRKGGSTACAVLLDLSSSRLVVADVGDSRAVLAVSSEGKLTPLRLSRDFSPTDPDEHERIERAGGQVDNETHRVGGINMSRALGDFAYKTPLVESRDPPPAIRVARAEGREITSDLISRVPFVRSFDLHPPSHHTEGKETPFLVLASDGVWNVLSDEEVVRILGKGIKAGLKLEDLVREVVETLGKKEFSDNVSMVCVRFG